MKLSRRIMILATLMAALPLAVVILLTGHEIGSRFQARDTARVATRIRTVMADLELRNRNLATLLDTLAEALKADNRFRLALAADNPAQRAYLADYAARQASLMRLDLLQIQDDRGHILSAAPLGGAQGILAPELPDLLGHAAGERALVPVRSEQGSFLALARLRPVTLAGSSLFLIAGTTLDREQLAAWGQRNGLHAALIWPQGALADSEALQGMCNRLATRDKIVYQLKRRGDVVRSEALPYIADGVLQDAWLIVTADQEDLHAFIAALRSRLWLLLGLAVLISALLAVWLTRRLTRPLSELAARTATVDLERLDVDFGSGGHDEVGELSRLLNQMTARLRQDLQKLKAAEQRATLGEVARQVNHDIRNGITPLRNILRHLANVAEDDPGNLSTVFCERRANLEEGLAYLEQLADRYARLTPVSPREECHLDRIVQDVVDEFPPGAGNSSLVLSNQVPSTLPAVQADPVALRRIFVNLVRNALESLPETGGHVTIDGTIAEDEDLEEPRLLISVSDDGCGIPPEIRERIFEDFFTTRSKGTGLGLSNVRRLVGDLGGRVTVDSAPGRGTTFTISLPLGQPGSEQA